MQTAHALGGFDIDRILLLDFVRLVSGNETEQPHLIVQVFQLKIIPGVVFEVVQAKTGEVGNNKAKNYTLFSQDLNPIIKNALINAQ